MNRFLVIISVGAALAGCSASSPECATLDAHGIVTALQPKAQFKSMLTAVAKRTQTLGMATVRDGSSVDQKLDEAVDSAVERHGAAWEQNLVRSWATLSLAETELVCAALNDRDQATFMRFANRVGGEVKFRNEPLLQRAGAEVIEEVWSKGE